MAGDRFVSEAELQELKQKRQEEWEKVRKPEDPVERPEDDVDSRPLFARLREQQEKKQAEYEETHRLKHMVRGLDDEEIGFLDQVDQLKAAEEKRREAENAEVLQEFKKAIHSQEPSTSVVVVPPIATEKSSKPPAGSRQAKLLSGLVRKRKPSADAGDAEKPTTDAAVAKKPCPDDGVSTTGQANHVVKSKLPSALVKIGVIPTATVKIGTIPSLCYYGDSEDDSDSQSSEASSDPLETMPEFPLRLRMEAQCKEKSK